MNGNDLDVRLGIVTVVVVDDDEVVDSASLNVDTGDENEVVEGEELWHSPKQ